MLGLYLITFQFCIRHRRRHILKCSFCKAVNRSVDYKIYTFRYALSSITNDAFSHNVNHLMMWSIVCAHVRRSSYNTYVSRSNLYWNEVVVKENAKTIPIICMWNMIIYNMFSVILIEVILSSTKNLFFSSSIDSWRLHQQQQLNDDRMQLPKFPCKSS